jgi:flagellar hook-length control protein FliK
MSATTAPGQSATGLPAKPNRGKTADPRDAKPTEAQIAGSGALAVQPLIAGAVATQASSQGTSAGAVAAGADSDATADDAQSVSPAATSAPGGHAAATPAITATLTAPRQSAEPGAGEPGSAGQDPQVAAAAPDSAGSVTAPVSAPFHAALQSALSAASRLDGPTQSPAASQPPGTTSDLASANAALSAAAAPGGTAQTNASAAPQTAAPVTVQVHAEVGSGGWANELGTRLHWMANQGIGSASLRLTPEQLGPVEVKISVHQNAASVWFSAAQPDTRSALEQALPSLKQLFSAQGLNLAQAGVSDQSARSTAGEQQRPAAGPRSNAARELSATSVTSAVRSHQGLIDTYA